MNQKELSSEQSSSPVDASKHSSTTGLFDLKSRSALLLIALVIIFAVLIVILAFHKSKPAASSLASSKSAQVFITANGFSPALITIAAGTQVTWINHDSGLHEVAADPYPKNNSIPGFNNKIALAANDSYSFRFSKAGTYHYHDQFKPLASLGTVVVK